MLVSTDGSGPEGAQSSRVAAEILTIGHSTYRIERFLRLLASVGVESVADVRRYPSSRRNPQFNAGTLTG